MALGFPKWRARGGSGMDMRAAGATIGLDTKDGPGYLMADYRALVKGALLETGTAPLTGERGGNP